MGSKRTGLSGMHVDVNRIRQICITKAEKDRVTKQIRPAFGRVISETSMEAIFIAINVRLTLTNKMASPVEEYNTVFKAGVDSFKLHLDLDKL